MFKKAVNLISCIFIGIIFSCKDNQHTYKIDAETLKDAAFEHIIDSFNVIINTNCQRALQEEVPVLAEKIIKGDSLAILYYFQNKEKYTDSISKIQKVITALQEECDSSLLKETYRRVRQLQKLKQKPIVR